MTEKTNRFANLSYDDFKNLAKSTDTSKYEKIGFPGEYRKGFEAAIFNDIKLKLTNFNKPEINILDIGPGCSDLPSFIIENSNKLKQELYLVDSEEMLALLPEQKNIKKIAGRFPNDMLDFIGKNQEKFDVILCYSVFHYIFAEGNIFEFLDHCLALLAHQGQLLIGDIPNFSKRKRFFSSPQGIEYHQNYTKSKQIPEVKFNVLDQKQIDDAVLLGLIIHARNAGFDAYLVPQDENLPMSNRREDLLIIRP